ncbi:MAG: glycosyltransferase family 39 protein, partial [Candidatus Omnitrophica bacterium]|nr:glycosyltransferase family 39 protein [Candidatus Omnitrophota bacterium]
MKRMIATLLQSPHCHIGIMVFGVLLRVRHFLENRSLWLDEAYLALNILESSFQQIWHQLPIIQEQAKAPLAFSLLVKSAAMVFGSGETALRLVPLLAALLAVYFFYRLTRRCLDGPAVSIALALFATCDALVYYAAELKPYSSDVFCALVLYLAFDRVRREPAERIYYILLGLAGWLVIWSSFPGILVLASIGAVVMFSAPREERTYFLFIGIFWLLNVLMVYKFAVSPMLGSSYITGSIAEYFPPAPLWTREGLGWLGHAWAAMFRNPLGMPMVLLSNVLLLTGVVSMWRARRDWCLVLLLPVILTVTAACLHKYPFFNRHLLFLAPALILFISQGVTVWIRKSRRTDWAVAALLVVALLVIPLKTAVYYLGEPREWQQNRAVMQYVTEHFTDGDALYFNTSAQYMIAYYLDLLNAENLFLKPLNVSPDRNFRGLSFGKIDDQL